ncbi:hypothetical protein EIN_274740 [Entamoeba invadens IP1]|uniref:Mechanosensitive ion channel MscS domain-containing protein n=1 Tax=Entamoeba invadens IP1 TaxID=370355 RepID=A0A0A1U1J7_ENTIV|nr:hypothetical protein EIN_274740 [Entamoeba invadens IP1]ELP87887.1 hypothetical protein EIN_274740 [Entamoeba invadens IP1]|eukprot:XP_004254658.1 hypothetical protein EIN_274740 [Entamoeba invadens IP1]
MNVYFVLINVLLFFLGTANVSLSVVFSFSTYLLFSVKLFHFPLYFGLMCFTLEIALDVFHFTRRSLENVQNGYKIKMVSIGRCSVIVMTFGVSLILFCVLMARLWEGIYTIVVRLHAVFIVLPLLAIGSNVLSHFISTKINISQLAPQFNSVFKKEMFIKYVMKNDEPNPVEEKFWMTHNYKWKDMVNEWVEWGSKKSEENFGKKGKALYDHLLLFEKYVKMKYEKITPVDQIILSDLTQEKVGDGSTFMKQENEIDLTVLLKSVTKRGFYEKESLSAMNALFKRDEIKVSDCVDAFSEISTTKELLKRKVCDEENIAAVISRISNIFAVLISLVVLCLAFGLPLVDNLMPVCTFFLGFSFIFGDYLRRMWESLVLVLFLRPFDIGDRISVGSDDVVIVDAINVLNTITHEPNGKQVFIPNDYIYKNVVKQHKRAPFYTVELYIDINLDTDLGKVDNVKKALEEFVKINTEFEWSQCPFFDLYDLKPNNKAQVIVWIEIYDISYNDPTKFIEARKLIIMEIMREMLKNNIEFSINEQPLDVKIRPPLPDLIPQTQVKI